MQIQCTVLHVARNLCGNPVTSLPPDLLAMDTLRRVYVHRDRSLD